MKHISILVPKGATALSCIEGSFILFTKANDFLEMTGRSPAFKVELVGMDYDSQVYDRLFTVKPGKSIKEILKTDLIIVPAVNGKMEEVIETNKDFFPLDCEAVSTGSRSCEPVCRYIFAGCHRLTGWEKLFHPLDGRQRIPENVSQCKSCV